MTRETRPRANVLGVGIDALTLEDALRISAEAIEMRRKGYVCLTGVHGITEARRDPSFRNILNGALLNLPDGTPMVWVGRHQGRRSMGRVFGPDFMLALCRLSARRGYTHFLYGGAPGVADELADRLRELCPGLEILGTHTPPFRPPTPEEIESLRQRLAERPPDVLWVGLSTPKQERFMASHAGVLPATLLAGVGAAFDYHTGRLVDAPVWIKRAGMQWAHRLTQEPRRLWRRYLVNNTRFLAEIGLQESGLRSYPLDDRGGPR